MPLHFDWMEPESLDEAKKALSSGDQQKRLVGGGTAITLIMKQGIYSPEQLISLKKLKNELNYIKTDAEGNLSIGCMTTLREIEVSPLVKTFSPVIVEALNHVANPRIRYIASIGGNLSHGDAHLDLPPILVALNAKVKAESINGERWIELQDLFQGYYETSLEPNEILTEVFIPKQDDRLRGTYLKYTTLSNDDWPTVGVAAFLKIEDGTVLDARICVSAAVDVPTRLTEIESFLTGNVLDKERIEEAGERAYEIVEPLEDLRGSVWYKKEMVKVHIRRALTQLLMEA